MEKKIIERIMKLLELSNSPYEAEALSAMSKAEALMAEYNIEKDALRPKEETVEVIEETVDFGRKTLPMWITYLAGIISSHFRVMHYYKNYYREKELIFVGEPEDVQVARATMEYAVNTANTLWKGFYNNYKKTHGQSPRRDITEALKNDYLISFVKGTKARLDAQASARKEMVPVMHPKTKEVYEETTQGSTKLKRRAMSVLENEQARNAGYADGRSDYRHSRIAE